MAERARGLFSSSSFREITIVVLGILIALAADAAWDARQDRVRERDLLSAIAREAEAAREALAQDLREQREIFGAARAVVDGRTASLSSDSTAYVHARLLGYSTYDPPLGVISGAIASGDLGLVRDRELRARIAAVPAMSRDLQDREGVVRDWTIEQMWTYRSRTGIPAQPSAAQTVRLFAALSEPAYVNLVAGKSSLLESAVGQAEVLDQRLVELAEAIDTALGR